ncbi:MotA/TolQ/ExbB proton channel family protein [Curvivirga sp.]|uniref:MotA/TolQ/ExbB proton channel family protein n=1 Tax=Curvivirga sp. TaxID=2856848 RepID=UPI003B5B8072
MQLESSEITSTAILDYLDHLSPDAAELFSMLGLMAWPLAGCAILTLAIVLERSVFFIRQYAFKPRVYRNFISKVDDYKEVSKPLRDEAVSMALIDAQKNFQSGIRLLRTISVVSPMLGLLGTILGIISAFKVIAVQKGPVSPSLIADGLWEAMLTTAVGLMIALPAIMAAFILKHIAGNYLHNLGVTLNKLSMEYALQKETLGEFEQAGTDIQEDTSKDIRAA